MDYITPTPAERGEKARRLITQYEPGADVDTAATDFLADLMHLLDEDEFASCLSSAEMHYLAERDEAEVTA